MVNERALQIIKDGSTKIRVWRTGMLQLQTFTVKRVKIGQQEFVELFLPKILDRTELQKVANDIGLPIEAENGRAMPDGKGEKDFIGL